MEEYGIMGDLGKERLKDLVREADDARRFLQAKGFDKLPWFLRSLLLLIPFA